MQTPSRFVSLLFVVLASCDTGTSALDAPTSPDVPSLLDAPLACLASGSDCSTGSGDPCCGPTTCVPTGGAGLFRCIDETGCIASGEPCSASDTCCGANTCGGGTCLPTP